VKVDVFRLEGGDLWLRRLRPRATSRPSDSRAGFVSAVAAGTFRAWGVSIIA
jgi:hypothetical protein